MEYYWSYEGYMYIFRMGRQIVPYVKSPITKMQL